MNVTVTCYNHPSIPATITCADCGAVICAACTHSLHGQPFCPADFALMRREPANAHLATDVPPYRPPAYRAAPLVEAAPTQTAGLFGTTNVGAPAVAQHDGAPDVVLRKAAIGCGFTLLATIIIVVAGLYGSSLARSHIPSWLMWLPIVAVVILSLIGFGFTLVAAEQQPRTRHRILVEILIWLNFIATPFVLVTAVMLTFGFIITWSGL